MSFPELRRLLESRSAFWVLVPVSLAVAGISARVLPHAESNRSKSPKAGSVCADHPATPAGIRWITLSDDGEYLDVAEGDSDRRRLDAFTGRELGRDRFCRDRLTWVQLRGADETWAGVNLQNQLEVVHEGEPVWKGRLPEQEPGDILKQCSLCAHRNLVAVVSQSGSLWLLKFHKLGADPGCRYSLGEPLADAIVSPAGDLLILVTGSRQFLLWDIARERVVTKLESVGQDARFASWSDDGRRLVTFGPTRDLAVWEALTGQLVRRLSAQSQLVQMAALNTDGKLAAVGDGDVIRLWDLEAGTELASLNGHRGMVSVLQFADRDHALFSGDSQGGLRRWSVPHQREIWAVP